MTKRKIAYSKLTFILSVFGFIGSLGFYFGVLKQVYTTPNNLEIEVFELEKENRELKLKIKRLKSQLSHNE